MLRNERLHESHAAVFRRCDWLGTNRMAGIRLRDLNSLTGMWRTLLQLSRPVHGVERLDCASGRL